MTTGHGDLLEWDGRLKKLLALSATTLVASVALAAPSWAAVQPGNNISVFHELDIVAASGYEEGDPMTVQVVRNGVVIGTTSGPAVSGPEGVGLEVNHEGSGEDDGSCWSGVTPDILPGDEITVESPEGLDSTTVLDVSILEGPTEVTTDDEAAGLRAGDIVLRGVAEDENGNRLTGLAAGMRDRAFGEFRASPNSLEYMGDTNEWRAIYRAPYVADNRGGLTLAQQRRAILNPSVGHELAWESPDLTVTMVSEGPNAGGPGVGCTAPKEAYSVTSFDDKAVNLNSGDLVASGTTAAGTGSVEVALADADDNAITQTAVVKGTTWSATFPRAEVETLAEGKLTTAGVYNVADPNSPGGTVSLNGATKQILKDTAAPNVVSPSIEPKVYRDTQSVSLNGSGDVAQIRYTIGVDPADPTATTGNVFSGPIQVTSSQTIKAIAVDAAGNTSGVASFAYEIDRDRPNIKSDLESGTYEGPRSMTLSSDAADVGQIRYTTNGDEPDANTGEIYDEGQPIQIDAPRTIKAVAIDRAGNVSGTLVRNIAIKGATATALDMPTKKLVLGRSRTIGGSVSPNQAGGSVEVTIDRPGSAPSIVRPLALDAASRYGFSYKPKATGTYRVTVSFAADDDSLESTSETRSFRVVRR